MIYPQHISLCTSTIENAGYVNRMSGVVRGRRLVTASYSITNYIIVRYPLKGEGKVSTKEMKKKAALCFTLKAV